MKTTSFVSATLLSLAAFAVASPVGQTEDNMAIREAAPILDTRKACDGSADDYCKGKKIYTGVSAHNWQVFTSLLYLTLPLIVRRKKKFANVTLHL